MSTLHPFANVRTPCLPRAVADYTQVLGFECVQEVPGVYARLVHGPLCVQLWACGAALGRWEKALPLTPAFAPGHHRVEIVGIHALHGCLRKALLAPCRTSLGGRTALHAHRLDAAAPEWQPWGAWEARVQDVDGNVLHLIDRAAWRPDPAWRSPSNAQRAVP
jgi:catechol 2,3-dioxygenase-like lactoylglutathione lyase family enzyme